MASSSAADDAPPKIRRRLGRRAGAAALILVLALVGAIVVAYSQRGAIGARVARSYLASRGVPAVIEVERLEPDGFVGRAVLGPPDDPDASVERIEVEFDGYDGFNPRVRSIRLLRPRLKASWRDGRLNLGTLQRLVDEFLARPRVVGPQPTVIVEQGLARISTAAGLVEAAGDARLEQGRLVRATGRLLPGTFAGPDGRVTLQALGFDARGAGDRLSVRVTGRAGEARRGDLAADGLRFDASVQLPYPASGAPGVNGVVSLDGEAEAARLRQGDTRIADARLTASLDGTTRGPLERLSFAGGASAALTGARLVGALDARAVSLSASAPTLRVARGEGRTRFDFDAQLAGAAGQASAPGLALTDATWRGRLQADDGVADAQGLRLNASGSVTLDAARAVAAGADGRGLRLALQSAAVSIASDPQGFTAAGPVRTALTTRGLRVGDVALGQGRLEGGGRFRLADAGVDLDWRGSASTSGGVAAAEARRIAAGLPFPAAERAAWARALRTLRFDAPDVGVRLARSDLRLELGRPARLTGEGLSASLSPRGGVLAASGGGGLAGGLALTARGPGLQTLDIQVPSYRLAGESLSATMRLEAALTTEAVGRARIDAEGRLARAGARLTFAAARCAAIEAERFGEGPDPLLTGLSGRACAEPGRPLLTLAGSRWTVATRFEAASALAPESEAAIGAGAGVAEISGVAEPDRGTVALARATITDRAAETRYHPLAISGPARLDGGRWTAELDVAPGRGGPVFAQVRVDHAQATGVGGADIDASRLVFAKDGLQPGDISPVAGELASEVEGTAAFTGRVDWAPAGLTSSGRFTTRGLEARTMPGLTKGITADVALASLAPLVSAPDQVVTADSIDFFVPMTQAKATFTLEAERLRVASAEAVVSGGRATLDPLEMRLEENAPVAGVLRLDDIDLGALLNEFNLADRVTMEAKIDGALPFSQSMEGLRFTEGRVFADGPGRLSIKREALESISADGATPAATPNAMQSFAYQAMENLAFDTLEARVNSQPMGRLGVLFQINGRHDPPGRPQTRVPISDLLAGTAFDRELPLPDGTPVNLTLDTSLNFDELLAAYSGAVSPPPRSGAVQR